MTERWATVLVTLHTQGLTLNSLLSSDMLNNYQQNHMLALEILTLLTKHIKLTQQQLDKIATLLVVDLNETIKPSPTLDYKKIIDDLLLEPQQVTISISISAPVPLPAPAALPVAAITNFLIPEEKPTAILMAMPLDEHDDALTLGAALLNKYADVNIKQLIMDHKEPVLFTKLLLVLDDAKLLTADLITKMSRYTGNSLRIFDTAICESQSNDSLTPKSLDTLLTLIEMISPSERKISSVPARADNRYRLGKSPTTTRDEQEDDDACEEQPLEFKS